MLPSDHFVRMYNEFFKMLEAKGIDHLRAYWMEISRLQDSILGPYIDRAGLAGMYEYWEHIRIEENCDATLSLTDTYFEFRMHACPSLGKVMDNDAGACALYCDHCAGWIEPLMERRGYYTVYDIISRTEPRCVLRIYRNREEAMEYARQVRLRARPYAETLESS